MYYVSVDDKGLLFSSKPIIVEWWKSTSYTFQIYVKKSLSFHDFVSHLFDMGDYNELLQLKQIK